MILGVASIVFLAVAVPVTLLMATWATLTALRILFPPPESRAVVSRGKKGVPVRVQDIVANERARRARATQAHGETPPPATGPQEHPLFADLWLRRN